ncbi:hypothetical protein [Streptomyces sp. NBC_00046]|uniref:hypothetical protein n=1 Tax=unclassified Streptomyces TaxID=2593676 RepID=UPI0032538275
MRLLDLILKALAAPQRDPSRTHQSDEPAPAIEHDATDESVAYLITRGSKPLAVVSTPAEARELILIAHDGLDWTRFGSHVFALASGRCACGLTEAQLARLNGHGRWTGGRPTDPYWAVEPVPAIEARRPDTFRIA